MNVTARQKADVRVIAQFGSDQRFDVLLPMKADRIDRALHPRVAGANYVELHTSEIAMFGVGDRARGSLAAIRASVVLDCKTVTEEYLTAVALGSARRPRLLLFRPSFACDARHSLRSVITATNICLPAMRSSTANTCRGTRRSSGMRGAVRQLWPEIEWIRSVELREQVTRTWERALELSPLTPDDLNRIPFTLLVPNCPTTFMEHKRCVVHIARQAAESMTEFMGRALPIDMDTVIAGAILADVGKLLEYEKADGKTPAEQPRRIAASSLHGRGTGHGVRRAGCGLSHHRCARCRRGSGEAHDRGVHRASRRFHGVPAVQEPGEVTETNRWRLRQFRPRARARQP